MGDVPPVGSKPPLCPILGRVRVKDRGIPLPGAPKKPIPQNFRGPVQAGPKLLLTWRSAMEVVDGWAHLGPHMTCDIWVEPERWQMNELAGIMKGVVPPRLRDDPDGLQ